MVNELLFFGQTILVSGFVLGALALGKEGLIACISLLLVLANIFVVKQITLFGFAVTSADVYVVGAVLGCNLLQEYFGARIAKRTIWISFFVAVLAVVMAQVHLWYRPNMFDTTQCSFVHVFSFLPRVVFASFVAHIGAQYLRVWLYALLKGNHRYFIVRNLVVTLIEQGADTVIFGFVGLYGVVHTLTDVFIFSFIIKVLAIVCIVPWIGLSRKFIKHE